MVGLDIHVYSANHTFKAEYVQPLLFRIVQTIQSASDKNCAYCWTSIYDNTCITAVTCFNKISIFILWQKEMIV